MAIPLHDLSKWQATSHPVLANRKPEDLFEAEFAISYKRLHGLLWQRILRLHGTLVCLEELDGFPFDHLYAPGEMSFWQLVTINFRDMYCIMMHALGNDEGPDAHTLPRFKNLIHKTVWLDPAMRDRFQETLRVCRFDAAIGSVATRIDSLRNHRVAHHLVDHDTGNPRGVMPGISLEEMRSLFDAAHSQFGALSFGAAYVTLTSDQLSSTRGGKPNRSCLNTVLDAVLKDSFLVNQPERRKEFWQHERSHHNPDELKTMNEMRERIGLAPA